MILHGVIFVCGLLLLYVGAEAMVRGASRLAALLGISAAVVGMTVVAYGTSAPELVVGIIASVKQQSALVYGNVIGSNIANLALVLGAGLLIGPIRINENFVRRRIPFLIGVTALFIVLSFFGSLGRPAAGLFLAVLAWYFYRELTNERRQLAASSPRPPMQTAGKAGFWWSLFYLFLVIAGIVGLVVGAEMMVRSALVFARHYGISERIIGITVVALGTSLPELAATIVAAVRRETDLLIGGLVGSNIFNILIILGVCGLIRPIPVNLTEVRVDFIFLLGLPVLLVGLVLINPLLKRWMGALLLSLYALFMFLLWLNG